MQRFLTEDSTCLEISDACVAKTALVRQVIWSSVKKDKQIIVKLASKATIDNVLIDLTGTADANISTEGRMSLMAVVALYSHMRLVA